VVGIVGGVPVAADEATPWQAEIYSDYKYTRQDMAADARLVRAGSNNAEFLNERQAYEFHHHCGAVLIADGWVLTAQHCITDGEGKIDPVYFSRWRRIRLGTHDLTQGGTTLAIKRVVMHHGFANRFRNDIALIQIAVDAQSNSWIDPRSIAPIRIVGTRSDDPRQPGTFKAFTVYGWGTQTARTDSDPDHRDDHGQLVHESGGLLRVNLNYVPRGTCARDPNYRGDITADVICAGYAPGGRDTCQGDSGGPLVAISADRLKAKLLVGIVSGGMGCAQPDTPGIYAYVPHYLPWIVGVVGAGALLQ
jgi:secreted trypsin-like serine protease